MDGANLPCTRFSPQLAMPAVTLALPRLGFLAITTLISLVLVSFAVVYLNPPSTTTAPHRTSLLYPTPQWTVNVTAPHSNLPLLISGRCRRPFTYCGIDSRRHLLHHYDVRAIPLNSPSPPVRNWARVHLVKTTLNHCRNISTWVVYSDTDAYISSRRLLARRLYKLPSSIHLVFMNCMWILNSGFSAWRTSKQADVMLDAWAARFNPRGSFFAEQRALLTVFRANAQHCTHRPNGFLGWHVKGSARHKTQVAIIARRFSAGTGDTLFICSVMITTILMVTYVWQTRLQKRRGNVLIRVMVWIIRISTGWICVGLVLIVMVLLMMSRPYGKAREPISTSQRSFTVAVPIGPVLFDKDMWCWGEQFRCDGHGRRSRVWLTITQWESTHLVAFVMAEVVRWSGVLWLYATMVVVRVATDVYARFRQWPAMTSVHSGKRGVIARIQTTAMPVVIPISPPKHY